MELEVNNTDKTLYVTAECQIIAMILSRNNYLSCCTLQPKHFLDEDNRKIFVFMKAKYLANGVVTIADFSCPEMSFYMDYVMECYLAMVGDNDIQFNHYQSLVKKKWKDYATQEIARAFKEDRIEYEDLVQQMEIILTEEEKVVTRGYSPSEIMSMITNQQGETFYFGNMMPYFNSRILIEKNTVVTISARPSVGKTAFSLAMLSELSRHINENKFDYNIVYYNLEMKVNNVFRRIVSYETGLDGTTIKNREVPDNKQNALVNCVNNLSARTEEQIKVISGSKTIETIEQDVIRRCQEKHTLVFIDYVGLIKTENKKFTDHERITYIYKRFVDLTKDYDCTFIVLCQLNRGAENSIPTLGMLKDSGEVEQSSDIVLMLHDADAQNLSTPTPHYQLVVGKNREGYKGIIDMVFDKNTQRFSLLDKR